MTTSTPPESPPESSPESSSESPPESPPESSHVQHTPHLLNSHLKTLRMPTMLRESTTVARQIGEHNGSYEL
jgi:hypothetical protein